MIGAVILAAGQSRRMGSQKLLLPFAGQTVISHIVDQVLAAPIERTVVVTAPDGDAIRRALAGRPVTFVANPDPAGEMLGSVRSGLRALPPQCAAAIVVLGDQPTIRAEVIADLVRSFHATGAKIVVPSFQGRRGHPLLFSADYFAEVLTQHDGVGLRGLLQARPSESSELEVADAAVLTDIDTPDDYKRMPSQHQPEA
jgi:molybdenum cofactor cytidylyltransferase